MITKNKNVLLATSAIALIAGSGCSANHTKTATPSKHAKYVGSGAYIYKASYTRSNKTASNHRTVQPRKQHHNASQHKQVWPRIFQNFRINHAYNQHPRVQKFVKEYGKSPGQLKILTQRSAPFMHMIVHEVERRNIPSEIALLPFVESGFRLDVKSSAKAAGLWQFIPSTGHSYGLKQGHQFDARMDPFAATGAALSYLQKLQREFDGDWLLALAAYNCGENRVHREIARNRAKGLPTTYWHLAGLPKETRNYVPRLLAFKELLSQAPRYGIQLHAIPNHPVLAQLQVDKAVDLTHVARMAGLEANTLRKLNPNFRNGITNPRYSRRINLPRNEADKVASIIMGMPSSAHQSQRAAPHQYNNLPTVPLQHTRQVHTVRKGDTLHSIAKRHGTSVQALMQRNGKRTVNIRIGERLQIA